MSIREIFHYLHSQVPMLFWPALWVQWPRVSRALAKHETNGDEVDVILTGACRIELKIKLAPQTPEDAIQQMMRTENVRFPVSALVQMNAFANMDAQTSKNAQKPVEMQLLAGLAPAHAEYARNIAQSSAPAKLAETYDFSGIGADPLSPPLTHWDGPKDPIPIEDQSNIQPVCLHRDSLAPVSWFRVKRANRKQQKKPHHLLHNAKPGTLSHVRRFACVYSTKTGTVFRSGPMLF